MHHSLTPLSAAPQQAKFSPGSADSPPNQGFLQCNFVFVCQVPGAILRFFVSTPHLSVGYLARAENKFGAHLEVLEICFFPVIFPVINISVCGTPF